MARERLRRGLLQGEDLQHGVNWPSLSWCSFREQRLDEAAKGWRFVSAKLLAGARKAPFRDKVVPATTSEP